MVRFDKPHKGNPNGLSVRQHVLPLKSIARFADGTGRVAVFDKVRQFIRRAKPNDDLFCAKRSWDEKTESNFMKAIEDAFQPIATSVAAGLKAGLDPGDVPAVSNFYALWYIRAQRRLLPAQDVQLEGILGGGGFTQDEEEKLEKAGLAFSRTGARIPARLLNAVQIRQETLKFSRHIQSTASWGIIWADQGEFLVPDFPELKLLPLSPIVAIATPTSFRSGKIGLTNLAEINRTMRDGSRTYYFARDLDRCPI